MPSQFHAHAEHTKALQGLDRSAGGNNDESAADKETEGPSTKRRQVKAKESDNGSKPTMSEKRRGKQKAKESKDEVEEHVEKKSD